MVLTANFKEATVNRAAQMFEEPVEPEQLRLPTWPVQTTRRECIPGVQTDNIGRLDRGCTRKGFGRSHPARVVAMVPKSRNSKTRKSPLKDAREPRPYVPVR